MLGGRVGAVWGWPEMILVHTRHKPKRVAENLGGPSGGGKILQNGQIWGERLLSRLKCRQGPEQKTGLSCFEDPQNYHKVIGGQQNPLARFIKPIGGSAPAAKGLLREQ